MSYTRPPLSREKKLAEALLKRIDVYIDKHGETPETMSELVEIVTHVTKELIHKVKVHEYKQHK